MSKGLPGFYITLTAGGVWALLWLGGCGLRQASSLQSETHIVYSFEVEADYATVYERIARRARQRYVPMGPPRHQPGVSAELFPDNQTGDVTLWDGGGVAIRYRLSARIQGIDSSHTQVTLYAAGKSDRREARLWAVWAATPPQD
ncbi:MAG: hypothetical protein KBE65_19480 [Phycisphaerae bacterium]|nr:hypothetical protein [Phycisphaerae bacterium]